MTRIAIVVGSVRPGRVTRAVAEWVHAVELQIATVQAQLTLGDDFAEYPAFPPSGTREKELIRVLDQLESWAGALKTLRG